MRTRLGVSVYARNVGGVSLEGVNKGRKGSDFEQ